MIPGLTDVSATIAPTVSINSMNLLPTTQPKLKRTIVDTRLHLPDMFELTFEDSDNSVISDLHVKIGSVVEVYGGASGSTSATCLIKGEVTSIEGEYSGLTIYTIIRGYEKSHRLQRASRTRSFVDMKDSDIASEIAGNAGFHETDITTTSTTHRHVSQIAQTDWDFLRMRAQEIGFETGVSQGKFFFRKASSAKPDSGGGLMGAISGAVSAIADALTGDGPPTLTFQENLQWFRPRRSAANLPSDVEVRVYDYKAAEVVVGSAKLKTGTAKLDDDPNPSTLADSFKGSPFAFPELPTLPSPPFPSRGQKPSQTARVIVNRPLDWGSPTTTAVDDVAKGVAEHLASTVLEATGTAYGDPKIQAGKKVKIAGVAEEFVGEWIVTAARHEFESEIGGYSTYFEVSGRHDRTLLGLASLGSASVRPSPINGHVIGIVTNNNDTDSMGRVKLGFPWLAPNYETDWARVVQIGMGKEWGNLFLPEVGDEVLVGFEFGDSRRPYVIGGLLNGKSKHPLLSSAVKASGVSAQVVKRGIVSRTGNQLTFEDEIASPMTPKPPTTGKITLGDADGKLQLTFDTVNGELNIVCNGGVLNPIGKITIEQKSTGGAISVKSAGDVTIEASAPGKLTLKGGMGVSIDGGTANVEIKGTAGVKLDGGAGLVELSGSMVKLN